MFRRPTDPDEKNSLYGIPLVAALGYYGYSVWTGAATTAMHTMAGLASGLCCIAVRRRVLREMPFIVCVCVLCSS